MEYIKLSEICDLQNGYAFKSSDYVNYSNTINCRMSNIRPGAIFDLNYSPKYLPDDFAEKYSDYLLNDEDIVIAMTDLAGDPKILGVPAQVKTNGKNVLLNQRVGRLILKNKDIDFRYLKYNLSNPKNKEYYKRFSGGGLQINISKKDILNLEIPLHEKKEQLQIADKLDNIQKIINIRKEEIEKCNKLIKSQFVEMFGNPLFGDNNSVSMTEVCEIIDGDRGSNYPKQSDFFEKEYCLFLNAKNVTDHGFDFTNNMFITKEKDEQLRKGKLKRGDVVLTTRGTVGNLAFYDNNVIYENIRINSGMVILRMNKEKINERFFVEQFKFQLDNIKLKIANGSAQPQLPISKMNVIKLLLPDIELQNKFAQIVEQIDKQKFEFEKSLKKLEALQAALMQEYFG